MAHIVNKHIRATQYNVTEYCKKEECWDTLKIISYGLPSNITNEYITGNGQGSYDPGISSEKEAVEFCSNKGSTAWFELSSWLKERSFLTPKARSQCFNMGRQLKKRKEPSVPLSIPCKKIWEEAEIRGWRNDFDESSRSNSNRTSP